MHSELITIIDSTPVGSDAWSDAAVAAAEIIDDAMRAGDREPVTELGAALARIINDYLSEPGVGPAVWALGKLSDPKYHDLFDRVLAAQLDGDGEALYQALIALNNLGEMEQYQSWAGFEVQENRCRARAYLATRASP
ncbi:MAG: hypothetical protein KJ626_11750 [Verrucomicrobia bacterium]|nr:hypothetical protein [Verrucomicrobiota bacterium]